MLSVEAQPKPRPPMHFESGVTDAPVPFMMDPIATAFAGFRIALSVKRLTSKVLREAELLMTIANLTCGAGRVTVELISGGAMGQAVLPAFATQTSPTRVVA